MSHNPRTTGDDESDTYSELNRAAVLLKEAEDFEALKLPPVATRSGAPEEALWRVLEFLRVTTFGLNRDLSHPDSTVVLSGKTRSDYPEGERQKELVFKAGMLLWTCSMVRDLIVELSEIYVPGKDLSSIGEIIALLKKHIPVLEKDAKRF
ncbi:uncharacterized protein NECHADRAFT_78322 [Fusarium vanettenii 77-13-4]|uniref:Uncharacterized protein n=1 Tax=Fusarium vanettenii (strain ATCC MYA-4622 / CBS 123669 / FGSC 9596 / NRRL 45880 / 77-13-4) TaxID=660122 RepID=C7ZFH2_FUSV7|nr:uncharacterized protein NECHADRAFT_78322 [Fusarium vanettenii 77-13-4]EEU37150.1 predicted protein [Fusarium vanettenii 77-13-4]